ncbi:diacylglycerol lipase-alpha [Aplysia californica]|uniref:sn-1-specific diacylglycerol lipase n=1 Tax=Aplysia californica TaxID=6500 RepID=A0ABM1A3M1_APLCA|nr:diacylglycerol lipase-alpha [Aplysia californica]
MPGIVVFRRRWSVGSDDLVVPMIFMIAVHVSWLVSMAIVRGVVPFDPAHECTVDLRDLILGHIVIVSVSIVLETVIAIVSTRGSILTQSPRASIEYLLYARLVVGLVELAWLILGAVWASRHYSTCSPAAAKEALLGVMVFNWLMVLLLFICLWCSFDSAGRKWVKMKKFQDSLKERRQERRRGNNRKQSGSRRNWRQRSKILREFFYKRMQRKAFRAYEESWDRRLQLLCCCVERKGHNRNSMSEIAALFTDFFRDLDVVPSDIIAGLVLLRKHQQQRMNAIISQGTNDVYQYLSGVAITPQTRFVQLSQPDVLADFQKVIHYMRFALAVYGWPVYVMKHPGTWMCRLIPLLRCCCCKKQQNVEIVEDNCCLCNFSTAKQMCGLQELDLVYCTYHVDIGETPFFVALDHVYKKVVVAVRGTLSLQDVLTDLKAEPETLPINTPRDDWQGHKGMIQAAVYIKKKLINDGILQMAWERDEAFTNSSDWLKSECETAKYELVLVGHSLGAGTAAILAILLKADYPNLHCYSYSPPGGLLTLPCVEETKSFITSVVVGKDCVPRVGLPQLEVLRTDILNQIKNTSEAKWKIISKGLMCCSRYDNAMLTEEQLERDVTAHPSNSAIGLSAHMPLYPPGNMIHVVRSHLKDKGGIFKNSEPIFQAVWANNGDFDEVLVSPTMINDHMPDNVLEALEKVVLKVAPEKPAHTLTEEERREMLAHPSMSSLATPTNSEPNGFSDMSNRNAVGSDESDVRFNGGISNDGEGLIYKDEKSAVFGIPNSETEEMVKAPLASPETLSMASGVTAFSPSTSINGRDSLRQSLHRCAEKRMDSPSELVHECETSNAPAKHRNDSSKGKANSPHVGKSGKMDSNCLPNNDVESATTSGQEDYTVRLRSGNTFSVKADIVNELVKQNSNPASSLHEGEQRAPAQGEGDPALNPGCTAIIEPSSHTHFVNPIHHKLTGNPSDNSSGQFEDGSVQLNIEGREGRPTVIDPSLQPGEGFPPDSDPASTNMHPYSRHSPLESNQHEYAHPNVYYSQAGIGYPHNAFHPPLRYNSYPGDTPNDGDEPDNGVDSCEKPLIEDSESENNNLNPVKSMQRKPFKHAESESNLLSKNRKIPGMRRSAEQGDIVHLCDNIEIFEQEEDKLRLCKSTFTLQEEEDEDIVNDSKTALLSTTKGKSPKPSVSFGDSTIIPSVEGDRLHHSASPTDVDQSRGSVNCEPSAPGDHRANQDLPAVLLDQDTSNLMLQETHL